MFPEKQIFWQFENVRNQILFFNSQFSFYAVSLATSATIPDKVGETLTKTLFQELLVPIRYASQRFLKALKIVKIFFCITSSYIKKRQRAFRRDECIL